MSNFNLKATISKTRRALFGLCAGAVVCSTAPSVMADADNYNRTLESTAWIITQNGDKETATGSGVYVDAEKRLVLTNAHVVGDNRSAVVFFPDIRNGSPVVERSHYLKGVEKYAQRGKIVAIDRRRDLALIELPKAPETAKAITLAESSTKTGSKVDSIGNTGGSDVLWRYNSGTVRLVYDKKFKSDHGQHDFRVVEIMSPIRQGESGGPVVSTDGELIAIAQSFSPENPLIGYCVDVSEIKEFIKAEWHAAPRPTKELLVAAGIEHKKHSTGHYEIEQKLDNEETQTVFVSKDTEYFKRAEVRKVWSLLSVSKEPPTAELMTRLLTQNAATIAGGWSLERNSKDDAPTEYLVIYAVNLDATASDEALEDTIHYVAKLTKRLSKQLNPSKKKSSAETLKSWLAN